MKAIIFDLDGTIINTENMWADATQQMLLARNIEYSDQLRKEIHDRVHGLPPLKACTLLKEIVQINDDPQDLAKEKAERAYQLMRGNIIFIYGFLEFFKKVQQRQLQTAVATNCTSRFVELADKEVKLRSFFKEHIYCLDHVNYKSKPDPALFLYAAEQLMVDPLDCVVIEDSAAGINGAKNAGMKCIGINTGGNKENLKHADLIIDSYDEIDLKKIMLDY